MFLADGVSGNKRETQYTHVGDDMKPVELQDWLKRRDTVYVPIVRAEEDQRRNISDGTPFGQSLTEVAIRDILSRLENIEAQLRAARVGK